MYEYEEAKRYPFPSYEDSKRQIITSILCGDQTFRSDPFDEFGPNTRKFVYPLRKQRIEIKVPLTQNEAPSSLTYSLPSEIEIFSKVLMAPKHLCWTSDSSRPPITHFIPEDKFIDDEYVVTVHQFKGFATFFTSYGRFAFQMDNNHNIYFVDYLDEERSEKFRVQDYVELFAGFKLFYCISNNYLYSIERIQHEIVIKKAPIKDKVTKIQAFESGAIFIKTFSGDWIIQNKSETPFSFLKSKQDFSKLDIHLLLGLKPKPQKKKTLLNDGQLPQCIEVIGNGNTMIGFLLEDFSLYLSQIIEKSKKKVLNYTFSKYDLRTYISYHLLSRSKLSSNSIEQIKIETLVQHFRQNHITISLTISTRHRLTKNLISQISNLFLNLKEGKLIDVSIKCES